MAKREMPVRKIESEEKVPVRPEVPETIEPLVGTVFGCTKLNIREEPDLEADVVCEVKALSKVMIDQDKSTDDWFSVCTEAGFEGYCLKRYVVTADMIRSN